MRNIKLIIGVIRMTKTNNNETIFVVLYNGGMKYKTIEIEFDDEEREYKLAIQDKNYDYYECEW